MNKGYFISFEGLDGSGKSTQINKLVELLKAAGKDVILTREPGGTPVGEKIRELILDPANDDMDDVTEAFLYASARAQLIRQLVKPALEEGKIIICDRFVDSSVAYQGYGRQLGSMVEEINSYAIDGYMPDLTFLLRLEPEGGQERISNRELDRIEMQAADFHQRTYEGYEAVAENNPDRVAVVNARDTIENIHEQIVARVRQLAGLEDL